VNVVTGLKGFASPATSLFQAARLLVRRRAVAFAFTRRRSRSLASGEDMAG
jgi:hypothetical protein